MADERPLRRSIKTKFQFIAICAFIVLFAAFITTQIKNIKATQAKIESVNESIAAENDKKNQLASQSDYLNDENFIIEQGRNRLGLVMPGDIIYIRAGTN